MEFDHIYIYKETEEMSLIMPDIYLLMPSLIKMIKILNARSSDFINIGFYFLVLL